MRLASSSRLPPHAVSSLPKVLAQTSIGLRLPCNLISSVEAAPCSFHLLSGFLHLACRPSSHAVRAACVAPTTEPQAASREAQDSDASALLLAAALAPRPDPSASPCTSGGEEQAAGPAPPHFTILFQDEHVIAIEKPSGMHVHPPEDGYPIPPEENILRLLSEQLGGRYLYPLHRLDRPTSGVLVFGLTREAASGFGLACRERRISKTYMAMCRGYAAASGMVDKPLDGAPSVTLYETLATTELPYCIGKFPSVRYSLVKVKPLTGHFHQIRRHLNRVNNPIVGDTEHGDRAHNRLFAGPLQTPGLFLKCTEMVFDHPVYGPGVRLKLQSEEWEAKWQSAFGLFGACPLPSDYWEG